MLTIQLAVMALAVSGGGDTYLIDFRADYCGPCRSMDSTVAQLAAEGYPVRRVDVDKDRATAARFNISSIPCFVLVIDGHEVDRSIGATQLSNLEGMFRRAGYGSNVAARGGNGGRTDAVTFAGTRSQTPLMNVGGTGNDAVIQNAVATTPSESPGFSADMLARLVRASVRLKIQDKDGNSVGSGTIVDAREGQALILTCGHIFRDSQGKGRILIDLFGPGAPQAVEGRLIGFDLKRDVGLVSMPITTPIMVAHVAPPTCQLHRADRVASVGCNNGNDATAVASTVASIDKFIGPPNVQVAGQPIQGRSGGGLFNADGQVIGVCNAADPTDNEGLFAALGSIHAELDRVGLTYVYHGSDEKPQDKVAVIDTPATAVPAPPSQERGLQHTINGEMPARGAATSAQLTADEVATLAELRDKARDAEVICIVRPLSDPKAKSEIIVLDRASPAFMQQLSNDRQSPDGRRLTSLEVPNDPPPIRTAGNPASAPRW